MLLTSWLANWQRHVRVKSGGRAHRRRLQATCAGPEVLEQRCLLTTIDLGSLGTGGVTIFGIDADDQGGYSGSSVGDLNGDGFDDFVFGAFAADGPLNTKSYAGESYVIFGAAEPPTTIDLANLGAAGIVIYGADAGDRAGLAMTGGGDLNGDGFDDLVLGAFRADGVGNANSDSGETYIIFGGLTLPQSIDLASPNGAVGVTILGIDPDDGSGVSVAATGDVNGDGFDDLLIGASRGDGAGNGTLNAGEAYVVFGGATLPSTINLSSLGAGGVTFFAIDASDFAGTAVSGAGDVNGDGYDDMMIGAWVADGLANAVSNAGETYVIYGGANLPTTVDLANLGTSGFTIYGIDPNDSSGLAVSTAGDLNGDGFDDLVIGAEGADGANNAKSDAGESYVIFGGSQLPGTIELTSLGTAGITIIGVDAGDRSGWSVSGGGDLNGDGFDDLLISAYGADGSGNAASKTGESYVIFGGNALPTTIDLGNLGAAGVLILGADPNDQSGYSAAWAGDVNGDGFDDLLIGSSYGDGAGNAISNAGENYIIFGGNGFTNSVTSLGSSASQTLTGSAAANVMNGEGGNDTLVGSGGADVLYGGSGDDVLAISDLNFRRINGGNGADTLRLDGSGLVLDLTTLADNKVQSIETIDIRGSGANTLTLNANDVLHLTSTSNSAHTANTLIVRRDGDDTVNKGSGWTAAGTTVINAEPYATYTHGALTLQIAAPLVAVGGGAVTWIKKQPPVDVLPASTVAGEFNLAGGSLTISMAAVGKRKSLDQLVTVATSGFGSTAVPLFANGHLTVQIPIGQGDSASDIQAFLRNITFFTKGKGLKTLTRTLDVTLALAGNSAHTTIHQTIHVKKKP